MTSIFRLTCQPFGDRDGLWFQSKESRHESRLSIDTASTRTRHSCVGWAADNDRSRRIPLPPEMRRCPRSPTPPRHRNPEAGASSYPDPHQGLAQQPRDMSDEFDEVHQCSEDSFPEAPAPRKRTRPASTIANFPGNCSTTSLCCKNLSKSWVI